MAALAIRLTALIDLFRDSVRRPGLVEEIAEDFRDIGPEARRALPYLVRTLEADGPCPREHLLRAVAAIGPDEGAIRAVERLLRDAGSPVRTEAAITLVHAGRVTPGVVEVLKEDYRIGYEGRLAEALGRCGEAARSAAPLLLDGARQERMSVADPALRALEKSDPDAAKRVAVR